MSDPIYTRVDSLTKDQRALIDWLIGHNAGREALSALTAIQSALESEKQANSNSARAARQRDALKARADLSHAMGLTDLQKRRCAAHARGLEEGAPNASAKDFDRMVSGKDTQAARQPLRSAHARRVMDETELWGVHAASAIAGQKVTHNRGQHGPLDTPDEKVPDDLAAIERRMAGEREKKSGVSPDGGLLHAVQIVTATCAGEEAAMLYGANGKIDPEFWDRACRRYNEACKEKGTAPTRGGGPMKASTFRTLLTDGSTEIGRQFKNVRAETALAIEMKRVRRPA